MSQLQENQWNQQRGKPYVTCSLLVFFNAAAFTVRYVQGPLSRGVHSQLALQLKSTKLLIFVQQQAVMQHVTGVFVVPISDYNCK